MTAATYTMLQPLQFLSLVLLVALFPVAVGKWSEDTRQNIALMSFLLAAAVAGIVVVKPSAIARVEVVETCANVAPAANVVP